MDRLLADARGRGASGLHLDPTEDGVEVTVRRDGVLERVETLPAELGPRVVGRLKALADLLAYRTDVPQEGRIADAKGVAAVMALGAAGVQVGTAYLLCAEATTSAVHRSALKSDAARITALTNVFTGRPARGIVNRIVREIGPISAAAPPFPLAVSAVAPLRAKAESLGSSDFSPLWAGQNASGCKEISASALTRELAAAVASSRT